MKRNIYLSYVLAASKNSWFWLGIWVFYYLRFTNYAGIGILEMVLISIITITEIPTGAVADLLGKRRALILSFLILTIGGFIMAASLNFATLVISVFILGIGATFYSGTSDALVYDSLKQDGKEDQYDKKIANIATIALLSPAVCGVFGGFMYKINPTIPFYASAFGYLVGLIASFFLIEPSIDTDKFSFDNFVLQTKQGLKELFKSYDIKKQTILLLSVGFVVVISDEMLNSFLGVEFGFNEKQLGVLWSAIYVLSALIAQFTPKLRRIIKGDALIVSVGILLAISLVISPILGLTLGGLILAFRSSLQAIFGNLASITINLNTESKYRATTLSTFNMIKNIPYVLTAYFIGSISDEFSAKNTAVLLGVALLVLIFVLPNILSRFPLRFFPRRNP